MRERGSILPLLAGGMFVSLALIFGVSASASLLIERARLFTLADGAAIAAAQGFTPRFVTRTTGGARVLITKREASVLVQDYLRRAGPGQLQSLLVESIDTPGGEVVHVTLSSLWSPPLMSEFFPPSLRVAVSATAQTLIR